MTARPDNSREKRDEPVFWHVIVFCIAALCVCIALGTWLLGDMMLALTLAVTLLAALAVKAFRAFDE